MEIPYETTPRKDTGLFNSKLGIWLFLASEVMLFGGLFSAYVFLRVGVRDGFDVPWPWGINVHKTFVLLGFVNTIILILSSVFVVFGWVALKERKWRKFQMYIWATFLCAAVFMGFKAVEYRSKLTQHHDIRLHDGSMMEGKILNKSFNVPFTAESVEFDLQGSTPGFIYDLKGDFPPMTAMWQEYDNGELVDKTKEIKSVAALNSWFAKARTTKKKELTDARRNYRKAIAADKKALIAREFHPQPTMVAPPLGAKLVSSEPFEVSARFRRVKPTVFGKDGKPDKLFYIDKSVLIGKGGDDRIVFEPHYVDMQLVPLHQQSESMVWDVLGDDHAKKMWEKNREKAYKEVEEYYEDREIPEKQLRGYFINIQSLHDKETEPGFFEKFKKEFAMAAGLAGKKKEHKGDHEDHAAKGEDGAHDHHLVIKVPRDKVLFHHSHGPRNSNYYAIYFTITALHGLHVIGGAFVLLYFAVFGKKLYKKNPEHLANRVEVGGLFWHFVDLVWIFLFPLMYLL